MRRGVVLLLAMIFLVIFTTFSVGMLTMSTANAQMADNHHDSNCALDAAMSGIQCARYALSHTTTFKTGTNVVTDSEANAIWNNLYTQLLTGNLGGAELSSITDFSDSYDSGEDITTGHIAFGAQGETFQLRFYRYDSDPRTIKVQSTGMAGASLTRNIKIDVSITKSNSVLNYAIASRGRMWLTGDSIIHGDIYSSWDREAISPFNITSDSEVKGTINTVLTKDQIADQIYQLETLDEDGNPMFDEYGDRIYSDDDEVQGEHDGINYDQPTQTDIPGMDIDDYDTDMYKDICFAVGGNGNIPGSSQRETEYFPHAAGNYNYPRDGTPSNTWNKRMSRHVYEGEYFYNVRLPDNYHALFRNCTFDGVLYIDCYKSGSTKYNNVRFEDCTFNGTIVTDVPARFRWRDNCLYFTGEAEFENTSDIREATILAPHFNVNLGNTNPDLNENNIITGAIVGGIVDVRGNAQIFGTIISMCDTTQWPSGYVTNIGATLNDGGSETTEAGDIGTIEITPDKDNMLPSGIKSDIVLMPLFSTYSEI